MYLKVMLSGILYCILGYNRNIYIKGNNSLQVMDWTPEEEQSEFNQAIASLQRIHSSLLEIDAAVFNEDYRKYYKALLLFWREMDCVLNEKEREKVKSLKTISDDNWDKLKNAYNQKAGTLSIDKTVVQSFEDLEMELRRLMQNHNMNFPKKADPRYALANK